MLRLAGRKCCGVVRQTPLPPIPHPTAPRSRCRRPIFTLAVLGFTLHTALFGVLAYWGPKAITFMFRMQDGSADVIFGGITVATGIFGTLVGGSLLDATGGAGPRPRFAAARVCLLSVAIGAVFLQAAFVFGHSMVVFAVFFALGELVLFLLQVRLLVPLPVSLAVPHSVRLCGSRACVAPGQNAVLLLLSVQSGVPFLLDAGPAGQSEAHSAAIPVPGMYA